MIKNITIEDVLYLYRIRSWRNKICGVRPLFYAFVAYAIAGSGDFVLYAINTLLLCAAFLFFGPFDDYLDYYLDGEENYVSHLLEKRMVSKRVIAVLIGIPFGICIFAMYYLAHHAFWQSALLYAFGLGIVMAYAIPPLRIKYKRILGFISAPLIAATVFLQAYLLKGIFSVSLTYIVSLIILFQSFAEALHVLEEPEESSGKISKNTALTLLRSLPKISFVVSVVFAFQRPFFIIFAIASGIQWVAVNRMQAKQAIAYSQRRNLLSPLLSLYGYITVMCLGFFGLCAL